jgi:kumamolisin
MKKSVIVVAALLCLPFSKVNADTLLRLKERVPLEKLAAEVLDPASSHYGVYFTPEEIRKVAGPDERAYGTFIHDLKNRGYTIVREDKTRLFITVRAPKTMNALTALDLQSSNLIDNIVSNGGGRRTPRLTVLSANAVHSKTPPEQIREVYGFNPIYAAGVTGRGQNIAVATYDGFEPDNVNEYYNKINLSPKPTVDVVDFNGHAALNNESAVETEVDAEFSGQLAPGASIHVFPSAQNSDMGEVQLFTAILDDNRSKIVNYSWGECESQVSSAHKTDMDKVFARAVAQGVNIFVASGDSGALGCGTSEIVADYPGAVPFIVAVGGTTLNVSNNQPNETAWNGSGGGISQLYDLPAWQTGIGAAFVRRSFPDVAFNADPQSGQEAWVSYHKNSSDPYTPMWLTLGGTSIAAPQWAGFTALVNEARGSKGSIGFLNPIIYAIAPADRANLFNDVTQGDNNGFSAGPGWDAVTGWGSMKASPLLTYLVNH